jgi:transketolase
MDIASLKKTCTEVRKDIINMIANAGSGHPGGSLSSTEFFVALYFDKMKNLDPKNPRKPDRDRFVLSKGHCAPALYGTLAERGYFSKDEFKNFRQLHSFLQGHPDAKKCPGVDASTGSLGQGVSIATGMALAAKKLDHSNVQVYTLLGDGELDEGLCWEAFTAANHFKLDNLTIIVDNNGLQIDGSNDEVMSLGDLPAKFKAFGFNFVEVKDGNDMQQVLDALNAPQVPGKPKLILSHTVKGKGVSYMEGQVGWHGKAPNEEQRAQALKELEAE